MVQPRLNSSPESLRDSPTADEEIEVSDDVDEIFAKPDGQPVSWKAHILGTFAGQEEALTNKIVVSTVFTRSLEAFLPRHN